MKLWEQRCLFSYDFAMLIGYANALPGHQVAIDQVKRTQLEANANAASGAGIPRSLHLQGLAGDLLLYVNGVYRPDSKDYEQLGRYWKSLRSTNRWGGDFLDKRGNPKPDGGHFSSERDGIK